MSVTFGPVGMLLLGMVVGFVLLFYVLLVVAEATDIYHDFNRSVVPHTPWKYVMGSRFPLAWPVSYAVLRLQLLLAHQPPVSWAKQRDDAGQGWGNDGVRMRVTGEVKPADHAKDVTCYDDTDEGL